MKFQLSVLCLLSLTIFFPPCVAASETEPPPDIVILYTGDGHGNIEPSGCCSKIGGMARRATKIKEFRDKYNNVIVAETGDFIGIKNLDKFYPLRVEHIHKAFRAIGYDAVNLGENEIFSGEAFTKYFGNDSAMPLISSNVSPKIKGVGGWPSHIIKEAGKTKIAIIGLTSPDFAKNNPKGSFAISDPVKSMEKYLPMLRKKADMVVLLSHMGWEQSAQVARGIQDIDIIIVGHESYPSFDPEKVGETLMVKNSLGGGTLGVIKIWTGPSNGPEKMESRLELLSNTIKPPAEYADLEHNFRGRKHVYERKLKEEKKGRAVGKYLKMKPEEFLERMKKKQRLMTMEDFLERNNISGSSEKTSVPSAGEDKSTKDQK